MVSHNTALRFQYEDYPTIFRNPWKKIFTPRIETRTEFCQNYGHLEKYENFQRLGKFTGARKKPERFW